MCGIFSIDSILSVFLGNIKSAYEKNESLENLLLDQFFTTAINNCQQGWRKVIATATIYGIPIPCLSTGRFLWLAFARSLQTLPSFLVRFFQALAFYDGYRSKRLPANLIQVIP